jgi:ankyrin repeat protein
MEGGPMSKESSSPTRASSARSINLEQQRKRAKDLLRAYRKSEPAAAARFREHLPSAAGLSDTLVFGLGCTLSDAQLVVAREAGFGSWPKLKQAVELGAVDNATRAVALLDAALAGDEARVDALRALEPALVRGSLHLAAALADAEQALALLDAAPASSSELGPRGFTPLICACSAAFGRRNPKLVSARVAIAARLLELGADPNQPVRDARAHHGWRWPLEGAAEAVADPALVELLVQRGARARLPPDLLGEVTGPMPARSAVLGGNLRCLELVLDAQPELWQLRDDLETAILRNELAMAELLIARGAAVNHAGREFGHFGGALHSALWLESGTEMLSVLLRGGADIEGRDRDGRTPLAVALRTGQRAQADYLRQHGALDSAVDSVAHLLGACLLGEAPERALPRATFKHTDHQLVCWAIQSKRYRAVGPLLALGLDPNVADDDLETPFTLAERVADASQRVVLLRVLSEAGAKPNDVPEVSEESFEAAADALVFGDLEGLRALLDAEPALARARSRRDHRSMLIHYVGANGVEQERQQTPPNIVALTELLLAHGADVNAYANMYGGGPAQTPLSLTVTSVFPEWAGVMEELVLTLVRAGANPNGSEDLGDPMGGAIDQGRQSAVLALVKAGARVDTVRVAAAARDLARLKALWPDSTARQRTDALFAATSFDYDDITRFLVEQGVPLDTVDNQGFTALHWAAFNGKVAVARVLLAAKAPLELKNQYGGTVLDTAAWAIRNGGPKLGHQAVVAALLAAGANVQSVYEPTNVPAIDELFRQAGRTW